MMSIDFEKYDDIDENDDELILNFSDDEEIEDYEIDDEDLTPRYSDKKPKKKKKPEEEVTLVGEILSFAKIIVVSVIFAFIITKFVIINAEVPSGSMRNTIVEDDRLIGFRLAYTFSEPKRGDIVIFKYPDNESENYVKRVIGTPGDVIEIKEGHVYVNGEMLEEDYILESMEDDGEVHTYVVPHDCYFMLGDNRNNSKDSRYWTNTFVNKKKILAKVSFRYYSGKNKNVSFTTF